MFCCCFCILYFVLNYVEVSFHIPFTNISNIVCTTTGCPIGYGGAGCAACPTGKYKNHTLNSNCTSCPSETTTGTNGAAFINECLHCSGNNTQSDSGTCFVDLLANFSTHWRCNNTFGLRCTFPVMLLLLLLFVAVVVVVETPNKNESSFPTKAKLHAQVAP